VHVRLEGDVIDLSKFSTVGYVKGRNIIWQIAWQIVSNVFFQPFFIPRRMRPFVLRLFGARVGKRTVIKARVRVHWPWKLTLGDDVWLGEGSWLLNLEPIVIGSSVCISQEAFLCTGSHKFNSRNFEFNNSSIYIGDQVWICARAIVLAGSNIPAKKLINAGRIVGPSDFPDT
jgi:putative colanic acid biosynthesis acetyltransferase WcaF